MDIGHICRVRSVSTANENPGWRPRRHALGRPDLDLDASPARHGADARVRRRRHRRALALRHRRGTATARHLLDIVGHSRTTVLPTGKCIKSRPFTSSTGGSSWRIDYYPNGFRPDVADFISVNLRLVESGVEPVSARATFSLLDQGGEPVPSHTRTTNMRNFQTTDGYGYPRFIRRSWLEESEHLKDDRFTIRCDVFVSDELRTEDRAAAPVFVTVPPSDLNLHLGTLLAAQKGVDVTFQVGEETFRAHRCVLAARSRVFDAELFGPMKESTDTAIVRVDDMEAEVFRALLGFVYTDTLPDPDYPESKQHEAAMAQHLLVAADRYDLGRLKLVCEEKLCKHIDTGSVAAILALAEQHHCDGLKAACFHFLSSPSTLNEVMATDGFEHLTRSCPSVLKELVSMSNIAAHISVGDEEAK
ncbi:hypothetical protein ACP4OV_010833 [Aristida adscensionis]